MQAMTERFEMRLDQDTLRDVDIWRGKQDDMPSRSEAIRRLIDTALLTTERPTLRIGGGETLIIQMLCDLFKSQKIKSEFDPNFIQSALLGGHLWGLQWKYSGIFHHHLDSPEVVKEVVDILDMWDFIEAGYANLGKKDKAKVATEAVPFGENPSFHGFDGNNESPYCGVAFFLVNDLGRFSRFKGRDFNSHTPKSVDTNRRMLKVFLPIRETLTGGEITAAQIIQVLKARVHPSRRKENS